MRVMRGKSLNRLHFSSPGALCGITRERAERRRLRASPERTHRSAICVEQYGCSRERSSDLGPIARPGVPLEAPRQLAGNHCTGHSDHQSKDYQQESGFRGYSHHPARLDVRSNCHAGRQHHRKVHCGVHCLLALAHPLRPRSRPFWPNAREHCSSTRVRSNARASSCSSETFGRQEQFCGFPE